MAFLLFNWYPAKIFMGDSGSLFLGFIISVIATMSLKYIHPVAVLYLAALPIMDTLIVMSPFTPDKTHIAQFFLKKRKENSLFFSTHANSFFFGGFILSG